MSRVSNASLLVTHIKKLKDLSTRRKLQETSKLINSIANDLVTHTAESAVSKAQALVQNLDFGAGEDKLKHAHEFSKQAVKSSLIATWQFITKCLMRAVSRLALLLWTTN